MSGTWLKAKSGTAFDAVVAYFAPRVLVLAVLVALTVFAITPPWLAAVGGAVLWAALWTMRHRLEEKKSFSAQESSTFQVGYRLSLQAIAAIYAQNGQLPCSQGCPT
jgi:hypothetical protein